MRTLLLALALVSTPALADQGECPFNAAKLQTALRTAVISFLTPNLSFAWNQDSLKVACKKGVADNDGAEYGCAVTYAAKDGTPFYLHDDVTVAGTDRWGNQVFNPSSDTVMSVNSIDKTQAIDDEGNYSGPVSCVAAMNALPFIVNKKTGNILMLKMTDFPEVSYKP
ncbi:MAG: hypothetical protein ACXVCI_04870 [Bdellovibrionota bacterium]